MQDELLLCVFCSVDDLMAEVLRNPLLLPVLGLHPARLAQLLSWHSQLQHVVGSLTALRTMLHVLSADFDADAATLAGRSYRHCAARRCAYCGTCAHRAA